MGRFTNTAEYRRKYYKQRRDEVIAQLGGKCNICGSADSLEIDHIDPFTKSISVSTKLMHMSRARINAELAKCQLLCKRCHAQKSRSDIRLKLSGPGNYYFGKSGMEMPTSKPTMSIDDGRVFCSAREAAKFYHIDETHVAQCARGDALSTRNRHFRYMAQDEISDAKEHNRFILCRS